MADDSQTVATKDAVTYPCQSGKSSSCKKQTESTYMNGCFGYKAQHESASSQSRRERFPHLYENGPELSVTLCGPCFDWEFWNQKVQKLSERTVIVDGTHYTIGSLAEESWPASGRGHGGRKFCIRFLDGREVTTTSLWYQGRVPSDFRDKLADNAEFVR